MAAVLLGVPAAFAQPVSLTILHTNDTHGHLLPFSYPDAAASGRELQGLRDRQGHRRDRAARHAGQADPRRNWRRAGSPVWLVDVGDYSDGTPFSTEYHGEADVAAMNAVGYDLGTLGQSRVQQPARAAAEADRAHQVRAGLRQRHRPGDGRAARAAVRRAARSDRCASAVFGLITQDAATYPAGKEAFDDRRRARHGEADGGRAASRGRHRRRCCRTPASDMDERIAAEVPEIDVIVGGHSHSRLPSGEFVWRSEELQGLVGQRHRDRPGASVGRRAGTARPALRQGRKPARGTSTATGRGSSPSPPDIPDDPAVAAVVDRYWKPIAPRYGEVIGQAAGEFASRGDDHAEYNLVADALRETFKRRLRLENQGGVRAPLLRGPITRADLVTLDPFDNTVVTFTATGKEIRQVLQRYPVGHFCSSWQSSAKKHPLVCKKQRQAFRIFRCSTRHETDLLRH